MVKEEVFKVLWTLSPSVQLSSRPSSYRPLLVVALRVPNSQHKILNKWVKRQIFSSIQVQRLRQPLGHRQEASTLVRLGLQQAQLSLGHWAKLTNRQQGVRSLGLLEVQQQQLHFQGRLQHLPQQDRLNFVQQLDQRQLHLCRPLCQVHHKLSSILMEQL